MRELILHVPVQVGCCRPQCSLPATRSRRFCLTRLWLLQPAPHDIRIAGLALCGEHYGACPAAAVPQDLLLMQTSQLQNIQRLEVRDAQCPDFPPMPRLTHLTMSFEPEAEPNQYYPSPN